MIEREIWQRFKDKELKVLAVGVQEDAGKASSWSFKHRLTYPVIIDPDGEIYKKFGNGSVPYHVLIGKDFMLRLSAEKFDQDHLVQLLKGYLQDGM